MNQVLTPHPSVPAPADLRITSQATWWPHQSLKLEYRLRGNLSRLPLLGFNRVERADQLWQHTCFEGFLRARGAAAYYELNFAPSGQWAAFHFSGYRTEMRQATEVGEPSIDAYSGREEYVLTARIALAGFSIDITDARLALSTVIEDADGQRSYWALTHPLSKPDFHHPASFVAELGVAA